MALLAAVRLAPVLTVPGGHRTVGPGHHGERPVVALPDVQHLPPTGGDQLGDRGRIALQFQAEATRGALRAARSFEISDGVDLKHREHTRGERRLQCFNLR